MWNVLGIWNRDNKNVIKNWYFPYFPMIWPMMSHSSCGECWRFLLLGGLLFAGSWLFCLSGSSCSCRCDVLSGIDVRLLVIVSSILYNVLFAQAFFLLWFTTSLLLFFSLLPLVYIVFNVVTLLNGYFLLVFWCLYHDLCWHSFQIGQLQHRRLQANIHI